LPVCQVLGGTFFCPNSNILDKRVETNCVLGHYNRNKVVITANCPLISNSTTDFTVQLGANKFLLYHSNSRDVQLSCGKESETRSFHGLKQLHVPARCRLFSELYIIEGQQNFLLSMTTFIERHVNVTELFNFSRLHVDSKTRVQLDYQQANSISENHCHHLTQSGKTTVNQQSHFCYNNPKFGSKRFLIRSTF
jgi:spore coat polysaccharide biosynthesis protein SpsF (cytidylyltransferase family)